MNFVDGFFVLDRRLPVTREVQAALDALATDTEVLQDAKETRGTTGTGDASEVPSRESRVVGAWHKTPPQSGGSCVSYRVLRGEEDAWIDSGSLSAEETRLAEQFEASLWPSVKAMRKWQRR